MQMHPVLSGRGAFVFDKVTDAAHGSADDQVGANSGADHRAAPLFRPCNPTQGTARFMVPLSVEPKSLRQGPVAAGA